MAQPLTCLGVYVVWVLGFRAEGNGGPFEGELTDDPKHDLILLVVYSPGPGARAAGVNTFSGWQFEVHGEGRN